MLVFAISGYSGTGKTTLCRVLLNYLDASTKSALIFSSYMSDIELLKAGIDIDDFSGSIPHAVKASGGRFWAPYYKHLTYDRLNEAHDLGLQIFVWTPDEPSAMVRLIEMGVDGIITNRPDILKSLVRGP